MPRLLILLMPALLLQGCLGLGRTAPTIPDRELPHELAADVTAQVYVSAGAGPDGVPTYVVQSYTIPKGFVVFAPELIRPPPGKAAP